MRSFHPSRKTLFLSLIWLCSVYGLGQAAQTAAGPTSQKTEAGTGTGTNGARDKAEDLGYNSGSSKPDSNGASPEDANKTPDLRPGEDLTSLAVPHNLPVMDPAPPLRGTFPDFTREFLQLAWRPYDVIDLYVMKPVGVEKPPVILYLYTFPGDTDRFKANRFAEIATQHGFAAVGFVSALTGQRFHDRPMKEWFVSQLQESLAYSVHDVQLILNYLTKRGDLDMTRVGMFADGSGASIAIMAASVDPRIKTLDLFDAWGDWPDWLAHSSLVPDDERANYLKPEFLDKVKTLDPANYLPQLTTPKVRLQYLQSDTVTPKAARDRMLAAAPPNAKIVHYENARIFLQNAGVNGKMFDWVKEQLVPGSVPVESAKGATAPAAPAGDKGSPR